MRNVRYFSLSDVESLSDLGEKYEYGPLRGGMESGRRHKMGFFCVDSKVNLGDSSCRKILENVGL